jgi:GPI mannosyltransferase 3
MTADSPGWSGPERRHFRFAQAVSALLFLVCAIFSAGSHDADEYFQVVELASAKLAISDPAGLTWEYRQEMRPWLQPAVYVGVARAAEAFGIHRPLTLLFLFRLTSALFAWSALWTLIVAGRRWLGREADRRRLYAIAALLWLLPFAGVRTSGETFAAAALCFGIAALQWGASPRRRAAGLGSAVLGGFAFGLCFEFRYASGVMAAGAGLWFLVYAKDRALVFAGLLIGALAALAAGELADFWGYGHVTFPVYSYLYQNFVLGRAAREFGTAPFFAYLYLPLQESGLMAPLVLALMLATLAAWFARARNVLTWASAPYVALLCLVGHKEARFLFPLFPFLPFFVVFALAAEPPRLAARLAYPLRRLADADWRRLVYLFNVGGLAGVVLLPQGANFPLYRRIEDASYAARGPLDVAVVAAPSKMPYLYVTHRMAFIEPKNVKWLSAPSVAELVATRSRGETFFALIDIPVKFPESAAWIRNRCQFVWSTFPRWLEPYDLFGWEDRSHWWEFYRCAGTQSRQALFGASSPTFAAAAVP